MLPPPPRCPCTPQSSFITFPPPSFHPHQNCLPLVTSGRHGTKFKRCFSYSSQGTPYQHLRLATSFISINSTSYSEYFYPRVPPWTQLLNFSSLACLEKADVIPGLWTNHLLTGEFRIVNPVFCQPHSTGKWLKSHYHNIKTLHYLSNKSLVPHFNFQLHHHSMMHRNKSRHHLGFSLTSHRISAKCLQLLTVF